MMRLNNKGQSLVTFILVLPILLGIIALVVDLGNALNKKSEIDNVIEFVLSYQLDNKIDIVESVNSDIDAENEYLEVKTEEESIKLLLDYNLKTSDNKVTIEDKKITILSQTYVEGIFSNILNIKGFKIESEYKGYIKNQEQVIEKIK